MQRRKRVRQRGKRKMLMTFKRNVLAPFLQHLAHWMKVVLEGFDELDFAAFT